MESSYIIIVVEAVGPFLWSGWLSKIFKFLIMTLNQYILGVDSTINIHLCLVISTRKAFEVTNCFSYYKINVHAVAAACNLSTTCMH